MADEKDIDSFGGFQDDIHAIILAMRSKIGRPPTENEVWRMIWAESDEEREKILRDAKHG